MIGLASFFCNDLSCIIVPFCWHASVVLGLSAQSDASIIDEMDQGVER